MRRRANESPNQLAEVDQTGRRVEGAGEAVVLHLQAVVHVARGPCSVHPSLARVD